MTEDRRQIAMPTRRLLVDQVIASLRELVEHEGLTVGDRMPSEPQLAERLGVGRSTLREAIRALSHTGLLETRQGRGTFVAQDPGLPARLAAARVPEVFEVRRALEVLIAQLAAARRTSRHVERLRNALADCRRYAEAGDLPAFIAADSVFHQVTAEATGNSVLVEMYGALRPPLEGALGVVADIVVPQQANDRHEVLLDAIEAGNADAAVAATTAHLDETVALFERER
ncbi:FadR/GntR family transcriptional regulator [Cryptosporangium sp. NPDC048952]|uniref:FadR/GntR family transcriptional regulator n=1 Tax=Cryptosporangium sp. NPDC048952 TaxID=3363961 RepID=UPI0037182A12